MRWDVARELDRAHALPRASVFETLYRSETWREIERGRASPDAWREGAHRALEERAGRPLPPLHETWRQAQGLIEPNIRLIERLRPRYRLSVLSNADVSLRRRLQEEIRVHHLFDDVVCSAEVGMAKPEPGIFALAAERLRVQPGEFVFVDDYDVNVRAAGEVGMTAVLFRVDEGQDLEAKLAAVGVTPER
jgi:putative hydrolase of the HAD superfamily